MLHHKNCGGELEEVWNYYNFPNDEYPSGLYPDLHCRKCDHWLVGDAEVEEEIEDIQWTT